VIAIIDYDVGNLAAVANMLNRLGVACEITASPERVEAAERIILPGNGAFDACMRNLRTTGLIPLLERKVIAERTPLLGICVGAQMLGHASEEGTEAGLGWLDMKVRRFPCLPGLKVPHMGWTDVRPVPSDHGLLQTIPADARFYFVHSYYMEPVQINNILLEAEYGIRFAAGVAQENIIGVQFHPEKSHRFGKWLLGNFARGA
jgi:glutamine amidotransferase